MTQPAARLWTGRTVHVRERPFRRAFSYRIAMLDVDIDRLDDVDGLAHLLSTDRFNALALHVRDHGERRPDASLRDWVNERFALAGVDVREGSVRLLTFPRVLGFGFAPISVWSGFGADGVLKGVIYEVHNTFGEAHAYVARLDPDQARMSAEKEFFVSPFFDVSGAYRFTLRQDQERMELIVENQKPDGRDHVASMVARPRPVTDAAIVGQLFTMPFSGLGVVLAIHWQALRLWLKGARYHVKPVQRANRTTPVGPAAEPVAAVERPRKRA